MSQSVREIAALLAAPFPAADIEWRVSRTNRDETKAYVVPYITARAVADRLDAAVCPTNWQDEYAALHGGIVCTLSLRIDGEWIHKSDGADPTNVEATKGGISDALKRAAVKWGIGRYLYGLRDFQVPLKERGDHWHKRKDGSYKYWDDPQLPPEALPAGAPPQTGRPEQRPEAPGGSPASNGGSGPDNRTGVPAPAIPEGHAQEVWLKQNRVLMGMKPRGMDVEAWRKHLRKVAGGFLGKTVRSLKDLGADEMLAFAEHCKDLAKQKAANGGGRAA